MSATGYSGISLESLAVKPPSHPTYDLKGVIKLALAEDAADRGLWSLPFDSLSCPHFNGFANFDVYVEKVVNFNGSFSGNI